MKYSHQLPPFRRAVQKWHKAGGLSSSGCALNILFAMSSDRLLASQSYPGYGRIYSYYNVNNHSWLYARYVEQSSAAVTPYSGQLT